MAGYLVTGASGFIGTYLVRRLSESGHEVSVLLHDREPSRDAFAGFRELRGDITDPESLKGKFDRCDGVFHLAGCTIARRPNDFFRINRDGTENVARACASAPSPPKLMFVSSLAAVGPASMGRPVSEQTAPAPVSDYGRSKLQAEQVLGQWSDRLPIQIVRPPSVMGPCDPYMLGLFKTAKAGWVFLPGKEPYRYSMIHVDDLVNAMIHLFHRADLSACSGTPALIHLAQDPPLTFVETAKIVREHVGRRGVRVIRVPRPVCWTAAWINSLAAKLFPVRPLLNLDKMREAMAGEWVCDAQALTATHGFRFPNSLPDRIRQTASGYQEKGWM
jgi:nucleoside-diphosphate-sugar epimerase